MKESQVIKQFLQDIKDDIEYIDGGCPSCISEFCENINDTLKKHNLKIEYDRYEDEHIEITEITPNPTNSP